MRAIALAYERQVDPAPEVVATGRGVIAERILELARAEGIPIEKDSDLIACLEPLDVGDEIPVEAFSAVARILAFLYELNGEIDVERKRQEGSDGTA